MDSVLDLRQFSDRFVVKSECGGSKIVDAALAIIPGRHGHIYFHGKGLLGVAVDDCPKRCAQICRMSCCNVVQDGDDGINATFDPSHINKIADIVKPYRRRRVSAKQREKLKSIGRDHRFTAA